jgi:porphobilinogen synthase
MPSALSNGGVFSVISYGTGTVPTTLQFSCSLTRRAIKSRQLATGNIFSHNWLMDDLAPQPLGRFPTLRMRRLRQNPLVRELAREVHLSAANLILPLFVRPGEGERRPIASMPGHFQLSVDEAVGECVEAQRLGLGGVILFGIPAHKDSQGSDALGDDGIVQQALRRIKQQTPELLTITDLCFCEYTDHGHCGVVSNRGGRMDVVNDATLELLAQQAVSHARAGAQMIAPSGMMDGMVGAIRHGLDAAGFDHVPIMSYAAKYASAFYGPFREAAESAPQFGDRRGYQMDPAAGIGQALREVELDLAEGADIVMIKPALVYLDVLHAVGERFPGVPLAAYNVSGEYSMVKAAAERGWLDERAAALESLTALRRAGATILVTYWAKNTARWLAEKEKE